MSVVENSQRTFRLLIAESEISVALLVKSMLREIGAIAVGPAFNLKQAEQLAACCEVDGALTQRSSEQRGPTIFSGHNSPGSGYPVHIAH